MSERIKQLEEFITEDPSDPFNFYALALEYAKVDDPKALDLFNHLVKNHTDYVPTYYQFAKLYESLGQKENAIKIFTQGITIATQQNDLKTLQELRTGLSEVDESDE
jgi:tetratricopeptide (TPR) repeat protein